MTPAEEFAALIEEAKLYLGCLEPGERGPLADEWCEDLQVVLRAIISTWEAMELQEQTKSERYRAGAMCRHALRYAALVATKEPKP